MRQLWLKRKMVNGEIHFAYFYEKPEKYDMHLIDFQHYQDLMLQMRKYMNASDIARQYLFRALSGVDLTIEAVTKVLKDMNKEMR